MLDNLSSLTIAIAGVSLVVTMTSNRLIGAKDIMPWIPQRRAVVYLANGLMIAALAASTGAYSSFGCLLLGAIAAVGYAIYRQPGPDIAFYAGHGRTDYGTPDPKWILWILEAVHKIPRSVFTRGANADAVIRAGVIAGAYRGLLVLPMAIAMEAATGAPTAFLGLLLGLTFGLNHWFAGVRGPWKKEQGMVLRAELIAGATILWTNMAIPVILGSL
jgi:hypothetical protein